MPDATKAFECEFGRAGCQGTLNMLMSATRVGGSGSSPVRDGISDGRDTLRPHSTRTASGHGVRPLCGPRPTRLWSLAWGAALRAARLRRSRSHPPNIREAEIGSGAAAVTNAR
jgi:hypothetical protein